MGEFCLLVGEEYVQRVCALLDGAKHEVSVLMFDWRIYGQDSKANISLLNSAFSRAAGRGVVVRAVVNFPGAVAPLAALKINVRSLNLRKTLHAKILIIDSSIAVVGSHNFSLRALSSNLECSVCLVDLTIVKQLCKYFESIWSL